MSPRPLLSSRHFAPLLLLTALCLLFWSRVLFLDRVLLPGEMLLGFAPFGSKPNAPWAILQWDALAQYFPWRLFAARELRAGHIPLWNPHQFAGTPFLANAQSAVFYPLNFPFWCFDVARAFGIAAFLHSILASFGTYFLAQNYRMSRAAAVLVAMTFAFCGYLANWALLPTLFATASWLPLCILLLERAAVSAKPARDAIFLGLALACALLAGHAQIFFYLLLALLLRALFFGRNWRVWPILAGSFTLCLLLSAPQILPTLELARLGHRAGGSPTIADWEFWLPRALQVADLPSLAIPQWPLSQGSLSENFGYLSSGALVLAIFGSGAIFFRWKGIITPESGIFAGESAVNVRERDVFSRETDANVREDAVNVGESVINVRESGVNVRENDAKATFAEVSRRFMARHSNFSSLNTSVMPPFFAFTLAIVGIMVAMATFLARFLFFNVPGVAQMGGTGRVLLLWSLGAALLAGFGLDFLRSKVKFALLPLVFAMWIGAELFANAFLSQPTAPRAAIYPPTALTNWLQDHTRDQCRVLFVSPSTAWLFAEAFNSAGRRHPPGVLPPNGATVYGLDDVGGYDSLSPRAFRDFLQQGQEIGISPPLNGNMVLPDAHNTQLDALNVRFLIAESDGAAPTEAREVWRGENCVVYERQRKPATAKSGADFFPGQKNGKYQPETFRLGLFIALVTLAALAFYAKCCGVVLVKNRKRERAGFWQA